MGLIWNYEKISYVLDTMVLDFYCIYLIKIEKKNVVSGPKIGVLVLFTSVFVHFRVFSVVVDTHYGVIWNPEKIFYMLDTMFF